MEEQTNNPAVEQPEAVQEPVSGLEAAGEPAVEGTGKPAVQPEKDTAAAKQAKGVDLNKAIAKLAPEEQKAYKAFQADYTKKSQNLSEYEKQIAQYETYYNSLLSDPDIVSVLNSKQAKAEAAKEPDFSKMSDKEIFDYSVDQRVKSKLSELETKMDAKYGTYIQSKLVADGNKIISDFAEAKKLPVEDVTELAKYAVGHSVSLDEAYKVAYFDRIPQEARQEALQDLELKKKANLELGTVPTGVTPVMPEKPTFAEAAKLAEKQTGLSWSKIKP